MKTIPKDLFTNCPSYDPVLVSSLEQIIEDLSANNKIKQINEEKEIQEIKAICESLSDDEDMTPSSHNSSNSQKNNSDLVEGQRNSIYSKKISAMRRRLNSFDVCSFEKVPSFIVECFFDQSCYKTRGIVSCFGFLNGISSEDLIRMLHWPLVLRSDRRKIIDIYNYLKDNGREYYSYCSLTGQVMYCNGDLRIKGRRVRRKN